MKTRSARSTDAEASKDKTSQRPLVAVVDDDESVRAELGSLFRSMGFRTELFGGGCDILPRKFLIMGGELLTSQFFERIAALGAVLRGDAVDIDVYLYGFSPLPS